MAWDTGENGELIASSGGDWATLVLFEGDHDGDTPSNGTLCQARVKGNTESTENYWDGWQAGQNSTTRIVVKAETGSETDGTDGSGDDAVIDTRQDVYEQTNAMYMDWISLEFAGVTADVSCDGGGEIYFAKCYFRNNTSNAIGIAVLANITVGVGACLFKAVGTTGNYKGAIVLDDADVTTQVEVFNCTCYSNSYHGFGRYNGSIETKNCVVANTSSSDFYSITDENYCASEDATAVGANSITGITPADEWTTPATDNTGDFTIKDDLAEIYQAGQARAESWFTRLCSTDMVGTTWNSPPSMGCFEYIAAAAGDSIPYLTKKTKTYLRR